MNDFMDVLQILESAGLIDFIFNLIKTIKDGILPINDACFRLFVEFVQFISSPHDCNFWFQDFLHDVMGVLHILEKEGLNDFTIKLMKTITSHTLPLNNICFRVFVDLIRFLSSDDACTFRYQEIALHWWYVLWKTEGEHALRTCGGLKLLGELLEGETKLKPSASLVNFVVPSEGVLRKLLPLNLEFPGKRGTGIFYDVLDVLAPSSDSYVCYNLQFDGKLLKARVDCKSW